MLGGGKFGNGAISASFGYMFNCLAHDCLTQKWDKNALGYHSYSVDSPTLCNTAELGCLQAVQMELLCHSAPGQGGCAIVGEQVEQGLTGGNIITQYALSPNAIVNGTSAGHFFEDGYVMRALLIDSNNNAFIRTFGEGVNISQRYMPAAGMAVLNKIMGIPLFTSIGVENQVNVRFRMIEQAGIKFP